MIDTIKRNLLQTLQFAKSIQQIRSKTLSDYTKRPVEYFYTESDLKSFENVQIGKCGNGNSWIKISRIDRTLPPGAPEICKAFLKQCDLSNFKKSPVLSDTASVVMTNERAQQLVSMEVITNFDIRECQDLKAPENHVDVLIHTAKYKEMKECFSDWLETSWKPWAELEKQKTPQIDLYRKFFQLEQELKRSNEGELILGQNLVIKKGDRTNKNLISPLIEYALDLTIDENQGYSIKLTPKTDSVRIISSPFKEAFLPGASKLTSEIQQLLDQRDKETEEELSPFDHELKERVALISSGFLHPQAISELELYTLPEAVEAPICTTIWFIGLRPKSQEPYIKNIDSLSEQIIKADSENDLPQTAIAFGSEPDNERIHDNYSDGLLSEKNASKGFDFSNKEELTYYFPLPTNDEQLAILKLLENGNAVSVQGPPGTGKSHTIANIIAHYIAVGKRVLVSAKTPEALAGVREKLPEFLSKLTISILSSDAEGKAYVEEAIRYISGEAQGSDYSSLCAKKDRAKDDISQNTSRIDEINYSLEQHALNQLRKIKYNGEELSVSRLVHILQSESEQYTWFPDDLGLGDEYNCKFDNALINRIKAIRRELGDLIIYPIDSINLVECLIDKPSFQSLHNQLCEYQKIQDHLRSGDLPEPSNKVANLNSKIDFLKNLFECIFEAKSCLNQSSSSIYMIHAILCIHQNKNEAQELVELLQKASSWFKKYQELRVYRINYKDFDWKNGDLINAVKNLSVDKKAFGISAIFKPSLKKEISKITIRNSNPDGKGDWMKISEFLEVIQSGESLISLWNNFAEYFIFYKLSEDFESAYLDLQKNQSVISLNDISDKNWSRVLEDIKQIFPYGIDYEDIQNFGAEFDRVYNAIIYWKKGKGLEIATSKKEELIKEASKYQVGLYNELLFLLNQLGNNEISAEDLGERYRMVYDVFAKLKSHESEIKELHQLCQHIRKNHAIQWADQLISLPAEEYDDIYCLPDWKSAWEYARVRGFVNSLASRDKIKSLLIEKNDLEAKNRKLLSQLIEVQALMGLKKNMTNKISSALARFSAAFSKIGKSLTGVRSKRNLQEANKAMLDCYDAIPCWIIPEHRVEHHIPAKLKAFDLVVIDEASQSDITALPVILRGDKLLVVGDDKQVSPQLVGIEENKISTLMEEALPNHPLKNSFQPSNSLYDLIGILSPGKRISLREHFRCVESIINFCSKNFYSEPLIPLRMPGSHERLDPPLIDIYVEDGKKENDVNYEEAEVIVNEISKIVDNPNMEFRTIGVISLIGFKQAALVNKKIIEKIGIDKYAKHKILCGDARSYQGQEKDIIFLSMVASPNQSKAQTSREDKQRYNVAVSRARDRLVLVRSVLKEELRNPEDLKLLLIEHFERPLDFESHNEDLLDLCDSQFERDVLNKLMRDGYRLRPQFQVGSYFIDIVVEGENDNRLAIELDGDNFHGPDRFAQDSHRQKQLERVGWEFWRCWASDWYQNPEKCYIELCEELNKKNISPLGADNIKYEFTQHIVVKANAESINRESLINELDEECQEL